MELDVYVVDAFTTRLFGGNPAAVVPLKSWLPDNVMQQMAAQHNLSETAFFVEADEGFHLRWFTPTIEIELCGHATLAAAFVLFDQLGYPGKTVRFRTLSGPLSVTRDGKQFSMDFPVTAMTSRAPLTEISEGLGAVPDELYESPTKFMAVFGSETFIAGLQADFDALRRAGKNVIVTAPGSDCDFVSRFFAPVSGIDEDPVTGSAHTTLAPYWASRLGKQTLHARQLSRRGGEMQCRLDGDRVHLRGDARLYMKGRAILPDLDFS